jgi:hypothetical protein
LEQQQHPTVETTPDSRDNTPLPPGLLTGTKNYRLIASARKIS